MDETFMHFIVHLSHNPILPKTPRKSRALTELTEHSQWIDEMEVQRQYMIELYKVINYELTISLYIRLGMSKSTSTSVGW